MKTALLIIDIQNDYFPGGKYPLVSPLEAAQKAYMILQCFREHGGYHIHIQHISKKPDATFFISGDRGTDIHDSVAHFESEPIVYKHEPNIIFPEWTLEIDEAVKEIFDKLEKRQYPYDESWLNWLPNPSWSPSPPNYPKIGIRYKINIRHCEQTQRAKQSPPTAGDCFVGLRPPRNDRDFTVRSTHDYPSKSDPLRKI